MHLFVSFYLCFFCRQFCSVFPVEDVLQMDLVVSSFFDLGAKEAGPLVLAWAVFVCLFLSLPGRTDYSLLMVYGQLDIFVIILLIYVHELRQTLDLFRRLIILHIFVKPLRLSHLITYLKFLEVVR